MISHPYCFCSLSLSVWWTGKSHEKEKWVESWQRALLWTLESSRHSLLSLSFSSFNASSLSLAIQKSAAFGFKLQFFFCSKSESISSLLPHLLSQISSKSLTSLTLFVFLIKRYKREKRRNQSQVTSLQRVDLFWLSHSQVVSLIWTFNLPDALRSSEWEAAKSF